MTAKPKRVVVCLSTPPLVAVLGLLARLRGARFVYKVEDLYPDVAVALGTFRPRSAAARFFDRLSGAVLSRADAVVALDAAMGQALQSRGARRVAVIPNWADGEALRPDPEAGEGLRAVYGLGNRFVVLYSGNLRLAHRFDAVIAAARAIVASSAGPGPFDGARAAPIAGPGCGLGLLEAEDDDDDEEVILEPRSNLTGSARLDALMDELSRIKKNGK